MSSNPTPLDLSDAQVQAAFAAYESAATAKATADLAVTQTSADGTASVAAATNSAASANTAAAAAKSSADSAYTTARQTFLDDLTALLALVNAPAPLATESTFSDPSSLDPGPFPQS